MSGRTLATAFVELRADNKRLGIELKSQTEDAGATAGTNAGHHFGEAMKRAIKAAGLALAVGTAFVGIKAFGFLKQANRDASDLNETVSKAQNVFPNTIAALNKFASTSAAALGLSRQQALDGASAFGDFFNQVGIGEKQSLKMSTALLRLSADFGSFKNADPSQVMDAFLSATRGEYDALQRFLPTINAANVQAEALRQTHKRSVKDLTDADKATALYTLSLKGVGKSANDYAETAFGQANATRTWQSNLADIRAEIGTALMPVVTTFIDALNSQLVPLVKSLWATHGPKVVEFFSHVVNGMEAFVAALNTGVAEGSGFSGFMSRLAVSLQHIGPTIKSIIADVKGYFAAQNAGGDNNTLSANLTSAAESAKQLLPLVKEFIADLPSLSDVVNVASTVLGFLADHTDELREAMPLLVAAVVAYKVAQLASNIAIAASPVFKIADTIATRQQTAALRAQTTALTANRVATVAATVTQAAETGAQNAGLLTRIRSTTAMVAQRVAMVAVRGATIAWTAVQWLLNVALTANPIGLIIVGIAALIAVIVLIATKTTWFQTAWKFAWGGIKAAAKATVDWIVNTAWPFLRAVWNRIAGDVSKAVGLIKNHFTLLINFVKGLPGRIIAFFANLGSSLYQKGRELIQGFIDGIREMAGRLRDAIVGLLPGPLKKFAGMLGLASPSKLFRGYGQDTVEGFVLGVHDRAGSIDAAFGRILRPAIGGGQALALPSTGSGRVAVDGPTRWHPADLRLLAELIGQQMTRAIGTSDTNMARQSTLYVRGA
jgi:hypothetical protein